MKTKLIIILFLLGICSHLSAQAQHNYKPTICMLGGKPVSWGVDVNRCPACLEIVKKEEAAKKELSYIAVHDTLTGLHNREAYKEISAKWLQPNAPSFAMIFVGLDNFKKINDTHGHLMGDYAISQMGAAIANTCRSSDITGRYWGR